jgi:hypothetical protein
MYHLNDIIVKVALNYDSGLTDTFLMDEANAINVRNKFEQEQRRIKFSHYQTHEPKELNHLFGEVSKVVDATKIMSIDIIRDADPMYVYPVTEQGYHCDIVCSERTFGNSTFTKSLKDLHL